MTRRIATSSLLNGIKNVMTIVAPIGVLVGVTEYFFKNQLITVLSVIFGLMILHNIWLELRLRKIEK